MRSRLLLVIAAGIVATVGLPAAAGAATSTPSLTAKVINGGNAVRVTWSYTSDALQRDRTVEIQRAVGAQEYSLVRTQAKAAKKASWTDKTRPVQATSYRVRVVVNGQGATGWSAPVTVGSGGNPLPVPLPGCDETGVLLRVNLERAARGKHLLAYDTRLAQAARQRSTDFANAGGASHEGMKAAITRYGYPSNSWLGENYDVITAGDPVARWMGHGGIHRDNILNVNFDHAGVGCVYKAGYYWWTLHLGGPPS